MSNLTRKNHNKQDKNLLVSRLILITIAVISLSLSSCSKKSYPQSNSKKQNKSEIAAIKSAKEVFDKKGISITVYGREVKVLWDEAQYFANAEGETVIEIPLELYVSSTRGDFKDDILSKLVITGTKKNPSYKIAQFSTFYPLRDIMATAGKPHKGMNTVHLENFTGNINYRTINYEDIKTEYYLKGVLSGFALPQVDGTVDQKAFKKLTEAMKDAKSK